MFKELIMPIKKKVEPAKPEIQKEIYEQELKSLIRILAPKEENYEEYEANVLIELKENVELLQNLDNRATTNPTETIKEMEDVLILKAKCIIEEDEHLQEKDGKKKMDGDTVKKAKICLLANKDFSDLDKHQKEYKKDTHPGDYQILTRYLGVNDTDMRPISDRVRLNAVETEALLASGFHDQVLALLLKRDRYAFCGVPDALCLEIMSQSKKVNAEILLRDIPDERGYSSETMKTFVREGQGKLVMKYPNAFKNDLAKEDWEYAIKFEDIGYPYHLNDILENLEKSNLELKDKTELIDYAFKHNFVTNLGFESIITKKSLKNKYSNLNKILFITGDASWIIKKPEELEPENLIKVKKMIEQGYLTMFYDYNRFEYLKYFGKNDYDWLINVVKKHKQENLLLKSGKNILRKNDQIIYAEELMIKGETEILSKLINQGSFDLLTLPSKIFLDLIKQDLNVEPKFFAELDDNCFELYKEKIIDKKNDFESDNIIFNNIGSFNFREGAGHDDFLAYQKFIAKIEKEFRSAAEKVYKNLNLGFGKRTDLNHSERLTAKEAELDQKINLIKNKLLESSSGNPFVTSLEMFANYVYIEILKNDIATLEEDLNSIEKLNDGNAPINLSNIELMRYSSEEEKRKFGRLLEIETTGIKTLLEKIKIASINGEIDKDLKNLLQSDFGIEPNKYLIDGKLNTGELLENIIISISNNYRKYLPNDNSLTDFKKYTLNGSLELKNDDLFIRLAKKYMRGGGFNEELHCIDTSMLFLESENFNEKNWGQALIEYVIAMEENQVRIEPENKTRVEILFSGPYRDVCLNEMSREWRSFLNDKNQEELPIKLAIISETIDFEGGAGNLSRIESLSNLMHTIKEALENKNTAPRTKTEIKTILANEETRFEKDKWSQDDKNEFYNLAKEIIEAAPSLFSAFQPIFTELNGKEMKSFLKELLPLYQINLITLQETSDNDGEVKYNPRDLVIIKKNLEALAEKLKSNPNEKEASLKKEKEELEKVMHLNFKNRFGLLKVPENMDKESLRSLHNFIRYTGNINGRDANRETIISFYLGLQLNGDWEKFRRGEKIEVRKYLSEDKADIIKKAIEGRDNNILPIEIIGLEKSQTPNFQEKLQAEVLNSMVGNIETVDIKLGNAKRNIDELLDPDIYDDPQDKALILILVKYHKLVGTVLAKTFQNLSGKTIELTDEEKNVQEELASALDIATWTPEKVKNTQERIQPLSLINNLVKKMEENRVEDNINELERRLKPNEKIIEIFNRLDENFKTGSGAMAIGHDLEYLESLIIKESEKTNEEERKEVKNYILSIKEKMSELEKIIDSTKEYFNKIKGGTHTEGKVENERLKGRINEIEKILNSNSSEAMIISEMTKDPNLIIENMRQCLGCLRKEANNDTNLAFGDYNKFFIMSRKDKTKGSIADEIVFFLPVKKENGEKNMSFVMDRVYGSKSSDIITAHVLTVYKKYKAIKNKFKEAKISISIPSEALSSAGIDAETLKNRLLQKIPELKSIEFLNNLSTDIPKSSFSENYIEFGDKGARISGKRTFSALVIE